MSSLFFIHIPKTAGTSFRKAADSHFGKRNVVCDYGEKAVETSRIVTDHVYGSNDFWAFHKAMEKKRRKKLLCGHVSGNKYVKGMGVACTVTFLRDPVQRLVSWYSHFVRHKNYEGSFEDFYSRPHRINRQSSILENIPCQAVGVLGLTERYDESLRLINDRYGLKIKLLERNTNRKALDSTYEVSDRDRERILSLNKKDIDLYRFATELFRQRLEVHELGLPYAHCRLLEASPKRVSGWAWWENDDAPVEIDVRVNGQVVTKAMAIKLRPNLARLSPPRLGYVGFTARINAKSGDFVDCVVNRTGQVFPLDPKVVP